MTLSIIIPTWSGDQQLADMATDLCERIRPQCDELVVTEDAGLYWPHLQTIADIYLMHPNLGFTNNVNLGLRVATGDFMAVINSDVGDIAGDLRDLCIPGRVTSPCCSIMSYYKALHGAFFVIPRPVLENPKYGYLNSKMRDAGSDYEYKARTEDIFTWVDSVVFDHSHTGQSYQGRLRLQREKEREEMPLNREVDPMRHAARLNDDPEYRKKWAE